MKRERVKAWNTRTVKIITVNLVNNIKLCCEHLKFFHVAFPGWNLDASLITCMVVNAMRYVSMQTKLIAYP